MSNTKGTLTKAKLAQILADRVGFPKVDNEEIINAFCDVTISSLEKGEEVKISGMGNFIPNDKSARPGRNPITGEPVTITDRRVVTFRPGNKLRSAIQQSQNKSEKISSDETES